VVYPIIYRVSTIQDGAGFLPSTVSLNFATALLRIKFEQNSLAKDGWTQISQAIRREVQKIQGPTVGKDLL